MRGRMRRVRRDGPRRHASREVDRVVETKAQYAKLDPADRIPLDKLL